MNKAKVFKERRPTPHRSWNWTHMCRSIWEPGGYLEISGPSYSTHAEAILMATWHVTHRCTGVRQFKERT